MTDPVIAAMMRIDEEIRIQLKYQPAIDGLEAELRKEESESNK